MAEIIAGFVVGVVSFTLGMFYERRKWVVFLKRYGITAIDQHGERYGS